MKFIGDEISITKNRKKKKKTIKISSENKVKCDGMNDEKWKKEKKKGLSIEMEFDTDVDVETCIGSIMHVTVELLTQWKHNNVIEGVCKKLGEIMTEGHNDLDQWAITPKIVGKKKHVTAETILEVQTKSSAFEIYQEEKEYCDSNNIRIVSNNTFVEHTKKIGFLVGSHAKLASLNYYINELSDHVTIKEDVIDI